MHSCINPHETYAGTFTCQPHTHIHIVTKYTQTIQHNTPHTVHAMHIHACSVVHKYRNYRYQQDTSIENQTKQQRNVRLQVVGILSFAVPVLVIGEVEGDHGVDHVRQQLLLLCRVQLHTHLHCVQVHAKYSRLSKTLHNLPSTLFCSSFFLPLTHLYYFPSSDRLLVNLTHSTPPLLLAIPTLTFLTSSPL